MNNIPQEQNKQPRLDLLAAQRQLYSDAKFLQNTSIAAVVIAIGLLIFFMVRSGRANQASDKPLDATPPPEAQKMMREMSRGGGGGMSPGMQGGMRR